ncbi:MAG: hypothetical protein ABI315_14410 [Bacteroidia bacterium]
MTKIKSHKLGKLRIYLKTGEKVKSQKLLHKLFPKSIYRSVVLEAKKDNIMNASVFNTQSNWNYHWLAVFKNKFSFQNLSNN